MKTHINNELLPKALLELRPQGVFEILHSEGRINWQVVDSEPTDDEIDSKVAEIASTFYMEKLRQKRDQLLAETDWVVSRAVDASNDGFGIQLPQVWVQYRQALRDLPANTVDPANPVWPVKPQ